MPHGNRWITLAIVSSALLLIVIDMTVLYTALPTLTHELRADASEKLWIVNIYPLVMAGLLPGVGTLGDRFGHKPAFLAGLAVFGVASLWAAFSQTPASLITARMLLAAGAALMLPATLSLIRLTFTDPKERSFAIGVWASTASGGAALGPVVGGFLLEHFWWGSVFVVNVPLVLVAIAGGTFLLAHRPGNPDQKWDLVGSVQIMAGLIGLTFSIKELAKVHPSAEIALTALIGSSLALFAFLRRQRRATTPMIDFSLFSNRAFAGGVATAAVASAVNVGVQLVYTQRLQLVQGFSPIEAAYRVSPIALATFVAAPIAGLLLPRVGVKFLLWFPLCLVAGGLFSFLSTFDALPIYWIGSLLLFGFGLGLAMTAASSAIMLSAPEENSGAAASIEGVSYELGGSLGIALLGTIMTGAYIRSLALPAGLDVPGGAREGLDQAILFAASLDPQYRDMIIAAGRAAFDQSFVAVVIAAAILVSVTAIVLALVIPKPEIEPGMVQATPHDRTR